MAVAAGADVAEHQEVEEVTFFQSFSCQTFSAYKTFLDSSVL